MNFKERRWKLDFDTFGITAFRRFSLLNLPFSRVSVSSLWCIFVWVGSTCSEPQKEKKRSPTPKNLERSHSGLNFLPIHFDFFRKYILLELWIYLYTWIYVIKYRYVYIYIKTMWSCKNPSTSGFTQKCLNRYLLCQMAPSRLSFFFFLNWV